MSTLSSLNSVKRACGKRPRVLPHVIFNTIVVDRSLSMSSYGIEIKKQILRYINEIRKLSDTIKKPIFLSLTTFNNDATTYIDNDKTSNLEKHINYLNENVEWFFPQGSTRLIDTLIDALKHQERDIDNYYTNLSKDVQKIFNRSDIKKIITVITDGIDNKSYNSSRDLNSEMKQFYKTNGLGFFIGANQDAIKTGIEFGFSKDTSITIGNNSISLKNVVDATIPLLKEYSVNNVLHRQISYTSLQRMKSVSSMNVTKSTSLQRVSSGLLTV